MLSDVITIEDFKFLQYVPEVLDVQYKLDLSWLELSEEMNETFRRRSWPLVFTCVDVNLNTLVISRGKYALALYLREEKRLYRLEGSLTLQWRMVRRAFVNVIEGIIIIE